MDPSCLLIVGWAAGSGVMCIHWFLMSINLQWLLLSQQGTSSKFHFAYHKPSTHYLSSSLLHNQLLVLCFNSDVRFPSSPQNMVKGLRVSDLQTLLSSMGRSKSGLKQDLVGRALKLLQTESSPELLKKVRQLYLSRFPKPPAWLSVRRTDSDSVAYSSPSSSPNSGGFDFFKIITDPKASPNVLSKPLTTPETEVKLVPLPFYHTLETLHPPTELSECKLFFHITPLCIHLFESNSNGLCSCINYYVVFLSCPEQ